MKTQLRAFIAIDLSPEVRAQVAKLIRALELRIGGTKWVEPHNLHLTLKFLGDVPLNDLPKLIRAVERASAQMEPFELAFGGCGAFPNMKSPRTLWIGCTTGTEELTRLAALIEEEVFQLGYPHEARRFSPHLTIGRVKRTGQLGNHVTLTQMLDEHKTQSFGVCLVDEVALYSSELTRQGPIYEVLTTAPLG